MLPIFLVQALFGFGAACFVIGITIFHYFRDKVDDREQAKLSVLFSKSTATNLIQEIINGELPSAVKRDFMNEFGKIGKPRRRLRNLLLLFPIAGGLFLASATLASVVEAQSEAIVPIVGLLETLADSILLVALIVVVCCIYELVKLPRELT